MVAPGELARFKDATLIWAVAQRQASRKPREKRYRGSNPSLPREHGCKAAFVIIASETIAAGKVQGSKQMHISAVAAPDHKGCTQVARDFGAMITALGVGVQSEYFERYYVAPPR